VLLDKCLLGFTSRQKKAIIPWAKVIKEPNAWIDEECYPSGFQWADPSKICIHEVFRLLDHWRQQKQAGLAPLIWNPSSELISGVGQKLRHVQNQIPINADSSSEDNSDDEDFAAVLAQISDDSSEPHNNLPPSPSPHSKPSWSGSSEPEEWDEVGLKSPSFEATPYIPHLSCESNLSIYAIKCTSWLHLLVASSNNQAISNASFSRQIDTEKSEHHGKDIINTLEVLSIYICCVLDTGGLSVLPSPRGQRSAFLQRHQALGASGDISEEEAEQPHRRGKRQVKVTERAK
jgi:hypothetical protein